MAAGLVDEPDTRSIELGIRLAVDVGAFDAATPSLSRLVQARGRDTGQPVTSIVSAILGAAPRDPMVRRSIRSLPWQLRIKPRRIAIATVAAAILALLGLRAIEFRPPPPDAVLELIVHDDPLHIRHATLPLRIESWPTTTELRVDWSRPILDTMRRADFGAFVAPDRDMWMSTRSDSGGVDVTLAGVDGEIERLTHSRADEFPGSWSPDGKQVSSRHRSSAIPATRSSPFSTWRRADFGPSPAVAVGRVGLAGAPTGRASHSYRS